MPTDAKIVFRRVGSQSVEYWLTDSGTHAPPSSGPYAYDTYTGPPSAGASYLEPTFGGATVRRISGDDQEDDIYGKNGWWNADGTRYAHRNSDGIQILNTTTGAVTHANITSDLYSSLSFDPVDATVLFTFSGTQIKKNVLNGDGSVTTTTYWTAPSTLKDLGGTANWLSADGTYMIVRYGSEPSIYVLDRTDLGSGVYANPVDGLNTADAGHWVGITPNGAYLIGWLNYAGGVAPGNGGFVSWSVNHSTNTVAASPVKFWEINGDHGMFLKASDGNTYVVTGTDYGNANKIVRVDVTQNIVGLSIAQQEALMTTLVQLDWTTPAQACHITAVQTGSKQNWVFISPETIPDVHDQAFTSRAFEEEIIGLNVITLEKRRLAHHRSRRDTAYEPSAYSYYPRVSVSWDGSIVGWNSTFNQLGRSYNIYAIPLVAPF